MTQQLNAAKPVDPNPDRYAYSVPYQDTVVKKADPDLSEDCPASAADLAYLETYLVARVAYPSIFVSRSRSSSLSTTTSIKSIFVYPVVYSLGYYPVALLIALPGADLATYIDWPR